MASANSYSSPSTTGGNREDMRDVLTVLEPEATPFTSMISKSGDVHSTQQEKLADTLRAPVLRGRPEGDDANLGSNKATARARFGAYTQIKREEFSVTDIQQLISRKGGTAAVDDEYDYAKSKTLREMKRDMEAVNCSNQETQSGSNTTEWLTRGYFRWTQTAAQSVLPVPSDFRPPSASVKSDTTAGLDGFTEDDLNGIMQSIKQVRGGVPKLELIAGNNVVRTVDKFSRVNEASTVNTRYQVWQDGSKKEIEMCVEMFKTSMGHIHVMASEFVNIDSSGVGNPNAGMIFDPEDWELLFLDDLHTVDLDDEGGGPKGYAKVVWQTSCTNPKGSGAIYSSGGLN